MRKEVIMSYEVIGGEITDLTKIQELVRCYQCEFYTPRFRKLEKGTCDLSINFKNDNDFCSRGELR